jgi:tetratricopeptide (TPR) repeat protein
MQNNLAILLGRENQLSQAKSLAINAITYWQSELKLRPTDMNAAERLATALNTLGEISWRSHEEVIADQSFDQAETLLRRAAEYNSRRPETLSRLAGALHNRSLVAFRNREVDRARQLIQTAVEYQSKAIDLAPDNAQYQKFLKSHRQLSVNLAADVQPEFPGKAALSNTGN